MKKDVKFRLENFGTMEINIFFLLFLLIVLNLVFGEPFNYFIYTVLGIKVFDLFIDISVYVYEYFTYKELL